MRPRAHAADDRSEIRVSNPYTLTTGTVRIAANFQVRQLLYSWAVNQTWELPHMTRTIGAAIGAAIVFLFLVYGINHSGLSPAASNITVSARP